MKNKNVYFVVLASIIGLVIIAYSQMPTNKATREWTPAIGCANRLAMIYKAGLMYSENAGFSDFQNDKIENLFPNYLDSKDDFLCPILKKGEHFQKDFPPGKCDFIYIPGTSKRGMGIAIKAFCRHTTYKGKAHRHIVECAGKVTGISEKEFRKRLVWSLIDFGILREPENNPIFKKDVVGPPWKIINLEITVDLMEKIIQHLLKDPTAPMELSKL